MHHRSNWPRRTVLVLMALLLAACAALNPGPRTVSIDQTRLLALIAKRFPFNGRVADFLDVEVLAPRVKLLPDANRIATELDVAFSERLLRSAFQGSLALDYGLRFEPSDNSIRMTGVRVSRLQFTGVPDRYQPVLNSLAPYLAERLLNDVTLHRFSDSELLGVAGWRFVPGAFTVTSEGLNITLTPQKLP